MYFLSDGSADFPDYEIYKLKTNDKIWKMIEFQGVGFGEKVQQGQDRTNFDVLEEISKEFGNTNGIAYASDAVDLQATFDNSFQDLLNEIANNQAWEC